jgi:diguanylate cyclase (GGDEF)-like protein
MSLIRQIWLLLLGSLLLALVGSVAVNVLATRQTLQTQLRLKNSDNAQALALALSQQHGDRELMTLLMSAQFDTGYYREIKLASTEGGVLFEQRADDQAIDVPEWFMRLVPIESAPGRAQVSDGWRPLGALTVVSHASYAYDDLWRSSVESALWLAIVGLLGALLGLFVVRGIRRPLDATVQQAQALMDGSFVTVSEPRMPELGRLTRAMNLMVTRLKSLFDAQAAQVEALRRQAHHDPLTQLANRRHFLRQLDAALDREDGPATGGLVLLRLRDLAEMNRLHGHEVADRAILAIAQALQVYPQQVTGCFVGRLNGSDFALCLPAAGVAKETGLALAEALHATLPAFGTGVSVAIGSTEIRRGVNSAQCLAEVDAALARAESHGAFGVHHSDALAAGTVVTVFGESTWRALIAAAITEGRVQLVEFAVQDREGRLLHLECPLRLQLHEGGPFESASLWLPHALRGRLTAAADHAALALALAAIERDGLPRCINIAPASLADGSFASTSSALVREKPQAAQRLWIEAAEGAALEHFALLRALARELRPVGVRVGLEHAGQRLARIEGLYEAGLDYIKLDASVTRGLAHDAHASDFVRTTAGLLHALELQVLAEGVVDAADAQALWDCGIDGITGPLIGERRCPSP